MFDCVSLFNELDLLEIRLNVLDDVVEKFVIVESNMTHSGKPKPLYFAENDRRFEKFWPKIIHIVHNGATITDDITDGGTISAMTWYNETSQRDKAIDSLQIARPSDNLFMVSDLDEIPKPEKVLEAKQIALTTPSPVCLSLTQSMYWLNYAMINGPEFRGCFICNIDTYAEYHKNTFQTDHNTLSAIRWHMLASGCENDFPKVTDAGWHFSTIGGFEQIKKKLESFAHHDQFNNDYHKSEDYIVKCMIRGTHLYTHDYFQAKCEIQDTNFLPKYVQDNLEKFQKYII